MIRLRFINDGIRKEIVEKEVPDGSPIPQKDSVVQVFDAEDHQYRGIVTMLEYDYVFRSTTVLVDVHLSGVERD